MCSSLLSTHARICVLWLQAWAMLERDAGNPELARELFKCAVKADPKSEPSWLVSYA